MAVSLRWRRHPGPWPPALALLGALCALAVFPAGAAAHGPVDPVAASYLARVRSVPAGLDAQVIDADQRMWLRVASGTLVVLDYRGAPYLRFSSAGVEVNKNSEMYYLNQTPLAWAVPPGLTRSTPPKWARISDGSTYSWHDGRLHALATVALAPDTSYVGRWSIPVVFDEHVSAISGGLWHAKDLSIVWFWPILVLLACVLAALRVRNAALDARVARALSIAALMGIVVAGVGRDLHGRPDVSVLQLITLAAIVAFAGWALRQVLLGRSGYFSFFIVAAVAIWEGVTLIPTLVDGFVLAALPAPIVRTAAVLCLGCGIGLVLVSFRMGDRAAGDRPGRVELTDEYDDAQVDERESYA